MNLLNIAFSNVLKKHREIQHLTQFALANELGITRATIANYEQGKQSVTLETAIKASKVLKFDLSEITEELSRITENSGFNLIPENSRKAIESKIAEYFNEKTK